MLDSFFEKHKGARRTALLWAMCLITYATHKMFDDVTNITSASATAYATICALLTTVIAFYQWSRNKDELQELKNEN